MKKNIIIFLAIFSVIIFNINVFADGEIISSMDAQGKIIEILEEKEIDDSSGIIERSQKVKLEILTGEYKGEIVEIDNLLSNNPAYNVEVKKGDKVQIGIEVFDNETADIYIKSFSRQNYLIFLLLLFFAIITIIGGVKGLKAILSLVVTILLVLKVFLPLLMKGINPIPISIVIAIVTTIFTIFIISGINSKSISAIIGTCSGVLIAGLLAYIIGTKVRLTGLSGEEATILLQYHENLNFSDLLFSGIIIGALGAVMDVGMSIASSIEEIYQANKSLTRGELFKSGMNVGKDIMGTMTNTLILAYTGSSIPLMLLFMSYETKVVEIFNMDIIATEIVRSLSGSIGLVLTIPLTAFIATFLIDKKKEEEDTL